jgi:hypothetical protein
MWHDLPEPLQGLLINVSVRADYNSDVRGTDSHCGNREEKQSEKVGKRRFHIVTRPG